VLSSDRLSIVGAPRQNAGRFPRERGDAAFDKGLISFADDGAVLANPALSEPARRSLAIDTAPPLQGLRDAHRTNLALHRSRRLLKGLERIPLYYSLELSQYPCS